jgi:hypothetical protein
VQLLTDEQIAILLNRDSAIRTAWLRWNTASSNRGSLVVLDGERARRLLTAPREKPDEDVDVTGLA